MPVVIGGLILALLVMLLFGGTDIDRTLLVLLSDGLPGLKPAAAWVVWLAQPLVLILPLAAGAAWLVYRRRLRDAALMLAAAVSGWLMTLLVQRATAGFNPEDDMRLLSGFPNLGTATATIAAFALAFVMTRHRPARGWALTGALLVSAAAGLAPPILGRSWPSDSIGGWAFGLAWILLVLLLARLDLGDGVPRPAKIVRTDETPG